MSALLDAVLPAAEAKYAKAVADLEVAKAACREAENAYDSAPFPNKALRAAVIEAQTEAERAARLAHRAEASLEKAREAAAVARAEALRGELQALKAKLAGLPTTLEPHVAALLDLDAKLDEIVLAIATAHADAIEQYEQARRLATELGTAIEFDLQVQRPSLAESRLIVQRRLRDARAAAGRTHDPRWLESDTGDWRVADMSAAQRAEHRSHCASQPPHRTDRAVAHAALSTAKETA